MLGNAVTSASSIRIAKVTGQSYSDGDYSLVTFDNASTGVSVNMTNGTLGVPTGTPNSALKIGINYRLGSNGPSWTSMRSSSASRGMPGNVSKISIASAGSGYAVGDKLWLNNGSAPLGKDRVLITVTSVSAYTAMTPGMIMGFSAEMPDGNASSRKDGGRYATEPVYELNTSLSTTAIVGSGSGAAFKFVSDVPAVQISARKQHPFYIYTTQVNKINLEILLALSLTTTDKSATSLSSRAIMVDATSANEIYGGPTSSRRTRPKTAPPTARASGSTRRPPRSSP